MHLQFVLLELKLPPELLGGALQLVLRVLIGQGGARQSGLPFKLALGLRPQLGSRFIASEGDHLTLLIHVLSVVLVIFHVFPQTDNSRRPKSWRFFA